VSIFDISDSPNPVFLGAYNDGGNSYGVHGDDNYLCIADLVQGVELLDISNPQNPVEIDQYSNSAPHDLIYEQGYAYLADQDDEFLLIDLESSTTRTTTGTTDNPLQFISTILLVSGVCAIVIAILVILKKR